MTYGELRTLFKDVLDRDDCSDADADNYISLGLKRTERILDTRFQRNTYTETAAADFDGTITLPNGYLGVFSLKINDVPVNRITQSQFNEEREGFLSDGTDLHIQYEVNEGDVITLRYYYEFLDYDSAGLTEDLVSSTALNYTLHLADVVVYAALIYAGDTFGDERKMGWADMFNSFVDEAQIASDREAFSGGLSMTPYGGGVA